MVPLSLGRPSPLGAERRDMHAALAWVRPENVASVSDAERRALSTWITLLLLLSLAVALGRVWLRLQIRDLGYHVSSIRQVIQKLEKEHNELAAEVARLQSAARIEEVARTRLGMLRPEKGQETVLP